MPDLSRGPREELQSLRREYTASLKERLQAIEQHATALEGGWMREKVESLYHLAHRLAGSSAIYGCNEVAHAAQALELRLGSLLEDSQWEPAPVAAELASLLIRLRRAVTRDSAKTRRPR